MKLLGNPHLANQAFFRGLCGRVFLRCLWGALGMWRVRSWWMWEPITPPSSAVLLLLVLYAGFPNKVSFKQRSWLLKNKQTNKTRKVLSFFLVLKICYGYKSTEQLPQRWNAVIYCGLRRSTRICLLKSLSYKILDKRLKKERQLGEVQIALGRKETYQMILRGHQEPSGHHRAPEGLQ